MVVSYDDKSFGFHSFKLNCERSPAKVYLTIHSSVELVDRQQKFNCEYAFTVKASPIKTYLLYDSDF